MINNHEQVVLAPEAVLDAPDQPNRLFLRANRLIAGGLASLALLSAGISSKPAEAYGTASHTANSEATDRMAQPMPYFGYDTNEIWVEDKAAAITEAQHVQEAGGNVIRILTPYTAGGSEITNDVNRYCNSLEATQKHGQRLEIGLDGHFKDGRMGYFPSRPNEMQKLRTGLYNMMAILASGECDGVKATELNIGFNEPNYKLRYEYPNMPKKLANLLTYLAPLIRNDAEQLNINLEITAADITLSEANNPINFIRDFSQELKDKLKPGDPLPFDRFGLNFYAFGQFTAENIQNPGQATSIKKATELLRAEFGDDLPIGLSEVGAFSGTPQSKEYLYAKPVPETVKVFPGSKQGEFYQNAINIAACIGLDGVRIFHKSDDGGDALRTGDYYPDRTPKPSSGIVQETQEQNRLGMITCPE